MPTEQLLAEAQADSHTNVLLHLQGPPSSSDDGPRTDDSLRQRQSWALSDDLRSHLETHLHPDQPFSFYPHLHAVLGRVDANGARALEDHPAVRVASHVPEMRLIEPVDGGGTAGPPSSDPLWGLARLGASEIWARGFTGAGVTVGHLDTGVDSTHPNLTGKVKANRVFAADGSSAGSQNPYCDSGDHGTHTSATIVGSRITSGICTGMAPDAELICGTVIVGGEAVKRILAGMNWIVGEGVKLLSMSVGFEGFDEAYRPIMQTLRDKGVLPIVAIGNSGIDKSYSPGNYPEALSVGAIDTADLVPSFSCSENMNFGAVPSLCAPGVDIESAAPGGGYQSLKGTSMAAPHIAGLAALLLQAKPTASIDEIENAILQSCENPAYEDAGRIGSGIPNGPKALDILLSGRASRASTLFSIPAIIKRVWGITARGR